MVLYHFTAVDDMALRSACASALHNHFCSCQGDALYTAAQVPDAPSAWVADVAAEIRALASCIGDAGAVCSPAIAAKACRNRVSFL